MGQNPILNVPWMSPLKLDHKRIPGVDIFERMGRMAQLHVVKLTALECCKSKCKHETFNLKTA